MAKHYFGLKQSWDGFVVYDLDGEYRISLIYVPV